ncbi:LysM peptidoglycan-binding domain-containing protein [Candidatus Daviesbacteria bacterium]|nr:LysM peptidoglycan-binding domain-containing protein [Candidatus Daviesbacteria bacterium]
MPRKSFVNNKKAPKVPAGRYLEKLESNIQSNQSKVSLVLGALIVLVIGVLIFNYFNRGKPTLGPAQQTDQTKTLGDVSADKLPGKYTVKEGDTLFIIAENYYKDGERFTEIAKANNLSDPNQIENGQVLEIPKLETQQAQASAQPSASPEEEGTGTGGGNSTIWGPRIEGGTYTVVEDDWLSKIAGRAYGDVMAYDKIAKANNISNPDHIEPGQVLVIPR